MLINTARARKLAPKYDAPLRTSERLISGESDGMRRCGGSSFFDFPAELCLPGPVEKTEAACNEGI